MIKPHVMKFTVEMVAVPLHGDHLIKLSNQIERALQMHDRSDCVGFSAHVESIRVTAATALLGPRNYTIARQEEEVPDKEN